MNKGKNIKTSIALKGNKNAEKWFLENSKQLFLDAIEKANEKETIILKKGEFTQEFEQYKFDFIGELARDMGYYKSLFTELKDKFHELKIYHNQLIDILEANCFCNSKKGLIKEATAIVNLKSNHGWTDRSENNTTINLPEIKGITFDR